MCSSTSHERPVFIIGHGSSGTSILSRLLRNYLGVSFGTESQFLVRFHARRAWYGDLSRLENQRRLATHLLRERWFARCKEKFGFETSVEGVLAEVREPTLAGVVSAVFRLLAAHQGMRRWGDKTPDYAKHLYVLRELFPEGKYLNIVRDGRDVALSMEGRFWGAKNVYMAALDWQRSVSECDAFGKDLPADQFCEIRYEDLLSNPLPVFHKVMDFVEVHDPDGAVRSDVDAKLPLDLKRDNFDKWKQRWSPRQRAIFEQIAGPQLAAHGYETLPDVPSAPRTVWRDAYWRVDNECRKLVCWDYWKDNFYKLYLKGRGAVESIN